ncbi:MAG TPA: hypothetical protein VGJ87_25070 [Roseiflexaceae bacterium]
MSRGATKQHPDQAALREISAVIRALEKILADLRQGKSYQITRLTRLKRLCTDSEVATQFAAFVAQRSLQRLLERERPERVAPERWERYVTLAAAGVDRMRQYLAERTPETRSALREQLRALEQAQSTYENIPYGAVRIVECWDAMLVETALRCMLALHDTARLGYELARDYVERYNPRYGAGLIPSSAEPLEEVIGFWRAYVAERQLHTGIEGAAQ